MIYIVSFILGSCLGSFAYCFAHDWVNQQINLSRRSSCDHCSTTLIAIDLIPIISQILASFRCRYCNYPTSPFYIIVEFASGIFMVWSTFILVEYPFYFVVVFTLIALLMIFCDVHAMIIPDLLQGSLLLVSFYILFMSHLNIWNQSLLAFTTFIALFLFNILRPGSIGGADIKTFTILSLCIPIPLFPLFLLICSSSALLFIILRYVFSKKVISPLPFFPFIFFGFYCVLSM